MGIFNHKGKNLLTKKEIRCKDDQMTHLYTLIVKPDNTYEVLIDNEKAESGTLEEDWDFLPPKKITDPEAKKPEDWDDEMDGEWEPPMIDNPEYKGEWKPRQIDNPDYKGAWVHPEIDNPDYNPADAEGIAKYEKKMKDEQDEEERKKADEEAKKDEDDEDADDLDADEEDDIPEDDDEEADEPEHDEL